MKLSSMLQGVHMGYTCIMLTCSVQVIREREAATKAGMGSEKDSRPPPQAQEE